MIQSFSSDGFEIAFVDHVAAPTEGQAVDRLPVILVHGFASNHRVNWVETGWVKTLTGAGYRVIALDNRGHGASGQSTNLDDYGAPLMAEDVARLMDHLGLEHAHVMGYSMGARIAAFLALRHPERVATATFAGLGINMVKGLGGSEDIAQALEADSLDAVTHPTGRVFRAFAEQTGSHLPSLAACIRSARAVIANDDLATLTMPVLVAVGTEDVVGGSAQELAVLIPNGEAFEIQRRDHMRATGDRTYKDAYLAFLNRIGAKHG